MGGSVVSLCAFSKCLIISVVHDAWTKCQFGRAVGLTARCCITLNICGRRKLVGWPGLVNKCQPHTEREFAPSKNRKTVTHSD